MSDRGDRLIAALRNDPTLMYEVLSALKNERLVSPWMQSDRNQYKRMRRSVQGRLVAVVNKHSTRRINPWEASLGKEFAPDPETRAGKNFPTQSEAFAWCDMRLLEGGYVLAGGDP